MASDDAELLSILGAIGKTVAKPSAPGELKITQPTGQSQQANWQADRRWLATAHCLGASFKMLSRLHQCSPQAVLNRIDKELPVEIRSKSRVRVFMSPDELIWFWHRFGENKQQMLLLSPSVAASWLLDNFPYSEE